MKTTKIHHFPRWSEFRAAVDLALRAPSLPADRYTFYKEAFEEIASIFPDSPSDVEQSRRPLNDEIASELGALAKEITLSHFLAQTPKEPYFSVAHILRDALRPKRAVPTVSVTDERWIAAIRIALTYNERKDLQTATTPGVQPEHITFAQAIAFYTARGINVPLFGDQIVIQSSGVWSALAATVAGPLMAIGDSLASQYMNQWLAPQFDPRIGRVHLHPTPDLMGRKLDRSLPYGHLYRTVLKTLGRRRTHGQPPVKFERVGKEATHFGALFEAEPFTTYETMFPTYPHRVFEMLMRVVLYDELFNIPQCEPGQMERLMESFFAEISKAGTSPASNCVFNDVIILWRILLSLSAPNAASTFVERSRLQSLLRQNVGHAASVALLDSFVFSAPNSRYRVPADAAVADTRECAIVEASDDRYWIAPRPFLGPAFFARLVALYAKADKDTSSKIGLAFEVHLLDRMTQLGIQCRRADIDGCKGAKAGDLDIVIETPQIVALFELKKKGLTRRTNSGNDLQLAIDLACGVVRGFNQLARHELALLRNGALRFADGTKLELKGRRIVKCVISLADYGGMHDGAIVRNMLNAFSQIQLNPARSLTGEQRAGLEKANEELKTLQKRNAEFAALPLTGPKATLFDNFLFHNVFLVEYLLLTEQSAESLLQALLMGHRMVTGSRDPVFDHARFRSGLG